jgi:hypothetical protein
MVANQYCEIYIFVPKIGNAIKVITVKTSQDISAKALPQST